MLPAIGRHAVIVRYAGAVLTQRSICGQSSAPFLRHWPGSVHRSQGATAQSALDASLRSSSLLPSRKLHRYVVDSLTPTPSTSESSATWHLTARRPSLATVTPRYSQPRSMASVATSPVTLKGVIFDMDGTLTVPCLDFAEMRRRVGITCGGDILHVIDQWEEGRRAEAYRVIKEMEAEAKEKLQIMPGEARSSLVGESDRKMRWNHLLTILEV